MDESVTLVHKFDDTFSEGIKYKFDGQDTDFVSTSHDLNGNPEVLVTTDDSEDVKPFSEDDGVKIESFLMADESQVVNAPVSTPENHMVPQQYIILSSSAGNTSTDNEGDLNEGSLPKYYCIDGGDGKTYILAVPTDTTLTGVVQEPAQTQVADEYINTDQAKINIRKRPTTETVVQTNVAPSTSRQKLTGNDINQAWFTTRLDKNTLHNEGHKWKQGQWTKEEIEILEANIDNYCKDHNISDPAEIIFKMAKDERKDFYRTIALGLQRPLFSVYRRVTRMYDRKNHIGKYTYNEMKHLKSLRTKHGNDWAAIGIALGRSASSVKDKCRLMKDNCNSGKWSTPEEERLAAAVYKLTGLKPSENITSGLSWSSIAQEVGTRSEKQCRTKWLNYLNWKQQGGADWMKEDDNLLIEKISKMNVTDSEIDWVALSKDWSSVRSPQWLRGKWWALKRHIPNYNKISFQELLSQMRKGVHYNNKPKTLYTHTKSDDGSDGSSSPNSLSVSGEGSVALSYCPSGEEDGLAAFQVLQQWTPQILSQVANTNPQTSQIISVRDIQVLGNHRVVISTAGVVSEHENDDPQGIATIQLTDHQDLNVLTSDGLESSAFHNTEGEEIVTVSEFQEQPVSEVNDMMSHNVFETVTPEGDSDLVLDVTTHSHSSNLINSLKDPILMPSSDVECDKHQAVELTEESLMG